MVESQINSSKPLSWNEQLSYDVSRLIEYIYSNFYKALWSDWLICEKNRWKLYVNPKKLDRINPTQIIEVLKFLSISLDFTHEELKQLCILVIYHLLINSVWTVTSFWDEQCWEVGEKMLDEVEIRMGTEFVKEAVRRIRLEKKLEWIKI